jgi:hypothetical protein
MPIDMHQRRSPARSIAMRRRATDGLRHQTRRHRLAQRLERPERVGAVLDQFDPGLTAVVAEAKHIGPAGLFGGKAVADAAVGAVQRHVGLHQRAHPRR